MNQWRFLERISSCKHIFNLHNKYCTTLIEPASKQSAISSNIKVCAMLSTLFNRHYDNIDGNVDPGPCNYNADHKQLNAYERRLCGLADTRSRDFIGRDVVVVTAPDGEEVRLSEMIEQFKELKMSLQDANRRIQELEENVRAHCIALGK